MRSKNTPLSIKSLHPTFATGERRNYRIRIPVIAALLLFLSLNPVQVVILADTGEDNNNAWIDANQERARFVMTYCWGAFLLLAPRFFDIQLHIVS